MSDLSRAGSNSGEIDLALLLDPDVLRASLAAQYAEKMERRDKLISALGRFHEAVGGDGIKDKTTLDRAAEFEKQLRDEVKAIEAEREKVKRPITDAGNVVQGFFKSGWSDPLLQGADTIRALRTRYLQKVEDEKRAAAREEEARMRREAERLAALAVKTEAPEVMERAIAAEERAADAAAVAAAKPADITRSRSDLGVTSSLRRTLSFRVDDKAKIPLMFMAVVDQIVMATGRNTRDATVEQPIPGITFFWETKAR